MSIVIHGAHVISPGRDLGVVDVRVGDDGRIDAVGGPAAAPRPGDEIVAADGLTLLPGFVDIHSHGRGGFDFSDATDEAFDAIGRGKLADGVTSFLATGLTLPEDRLAALFHAAARYMGAASGRASPGSAGFQPANMGSAASDRASHTEARRDVAPPQAHCLGVHLEGPFFNPKMAGAQNPAYLRDPDADLVLRLNAICPVRIVSLAPELPGAEECIRELASAGIVVSGGHSEADYAVFESARAAGMRHLTHFCNAMLPAHHLRPTMVNGGLVADDVRTEIICDGGHLSDAMIRLVARAKGPEGVMLVTDAMRAAAQPDGFYDLGGMRVRVEKGRATLADVPFDPKAIISNVAGSVALFPDCFRRWVRLCGFPLHVAIKAAGWNQLRSLGIADRGDIAPGQVADLVLVDADLDPHLAFVSGRGEKFGISIPIRPMLPMCECCQFPISPSLEIGTGHWKHYHIGNIIYTLMKPGPFPPNLENWAGASPDPPGARLA